jgi:hypothetical protein
MLSTEGGAGVREFASGIPSRRTPKAPPIYAQASVTRGRS